MTPRELDIERPADLLQYLRQTGRIPADETPVIEPLAGGVSNRTVCVRRPNGEAWVIKQALPKLRVQVDWFSDPRRIHREAAGLRRLQELAPAGAVPAFVFEDDAQHLLAMTAVPEPHDNWKHLLLAGCVETTHVEAFGQLLGTVHRRGWDRRRELAVEFGNRSFFESLRVEPYYLYTAEQVPEAAAFLHTLVNDTRLQRFTLVHGDYSPKNILIHAGRLVLLDHEVIHFGDGAFDLGFALTHLLSKAHHLPAHRDRFARAAVLFYECYRDALGCVQWTNRLDLSTGRHTLACLLARVAGRSLLEYLDDADRQRQRSIVLDLMKGQPDTVPGLVEAFVTRL